MTAARERRRAGDGVPSPLTLQVEHIAPIATNIPQSTARAELTATRAAESVSRHASGPSEPAPDRLGRPHLSTALAHTGRRADGCRLSVACEGGFALLNVPVEGAPTRESQPLADEFNGDAAFPVHVA